MTEDAYSLYWSPEDFADPWQPIETAPRDGADVVLWHDEFGVLIGHYDEATADWWAICSPRKDWPRVHHKDGWFSPFMDATGEIDCSHWMPLPKPPRAA